MSASKSAKETPLMKQYHAIKAKHPSALLLFRVGDFYETFGKDATIASKILDIVLTKRANGQASHIELAGFPHHSLDNYLPKLVRAGYRVAICDQLEDPKSVKGIVKRGVTELVTPGLSFNDNVLEKKYNNYLASIFFSKQKVGASFLDLSTGEFMTASGSENYIGKLLQSFNPSEVIFSKSQREQIEGLIKDDYSTFKQDEWIYVYDFAYEKLTKHFETNSLKMFGIEHLQEAIVASGAILQYLEETEHHQVKHIVSISRIEADQHVWLDKFTIRNLELIYPQQDGGIPLIDILDHTVTPMGSRLMKKWIVLPLKEVNQINHRLEIVEALHADNDLRDPLIGSLKQIGDLERLISKVAASRINPREMGQLKRALAHILPIKETLSNTKTPAFQKFGDQINSCKLLFDKIENELKEDAPLLTHQGGIIKDGVHQQLDEYRKLAFSGKDYLLKIKEKEVARTGISSLKIAYNKVFGYYLEVSNTHKNKVPQEWVRKQTLINAERYITDELKVYEEKILNAEEKLIHIEQQLFQQMVLFANDYVTQVQKNAHILAKIDCLSSFAQVATTHQYVKPNVTDQEVLDIKEGRHPVIEQQLPLGESYISNNVYLDNSQQQIMIVTGPNMAGKSALLRQVALITLMAQVGSFVPAESAQIGVVDKIFTRVGASDNLSKGESTFMVEMIETASILNNLSSKSLILMDEIGRGTSTYDGVSIAWSIVEFLHNSTHRAKTLFATHYHELNQLAEDFPRIKNFNVSVKEVGDKVIFMRKIKAGGSEHSFGIHVAQMAGMPNKVVIRANEIMHFLEKDKSKKEMSKKFEKIPSNNFQMNIFEADPKFKEIQEMVDKLDINTISPVEALLKLNEIKSKLTK